MGDVQITNLEKLTSTACYNYYKLLLLLHDSLRVIEEQKMSEIEF